MKVTVVDKSSELRLWFTDDNGVKRLVILDIADLPL